MRLTKNEYNLIVYCLEQQMYEFNDDEQNDPNPEPGNDDEPIPNNPEPFIACFVVPLSTPRRNILGWLTFTVILFVS